MKEEITPDKYICGTCGQVFATAEEELDHTCPETGYTPRDFQHYQTLDPNYEAVSNSALERGAEESEKTEETEDNS